MRSGLVPSTKRQNRHWLSRAIALLGPLAVAVVLFGIVRFFNLAAALAGPVAIEPVKFTCGAREGETVTAEFLARNVSAEPVKLLGAESSCGLPPDCRLN